MVSRTTTCSVLTIWLLLLGSQVCLALSDPAVDKVHSTNISAFEKELTGTSRNELSDSCRLRVNAEHYSIDCRAQEQWAAPRTPEVVSDCGAVVSLTFSDEYFELGCGTSSFTGYFDPAHWMEGKIYGDDGVDVTGAPDSRLLVEGTNNVLVEVASRPGGDFTMVIPASGYVCFDWSLNGSSIILPGPAAPSVRLNQQNVLLSLQDSQWVTPYLNQGDVLTFHLPASPGTFTIHNFSFFTNASGVIVRQWTAVDEAGYAGAFNQLITLDRPSFSDIYLPLPPTDHSSINLPTSALSPRFRGDTILQQVTHPTTALSDILSICSLDWSWEDELLPTRQGLVLVRHWTILDWCGENELHSRQYIDLSSPFMPLRLPEKPDSPPQHSGEKP